MIASRPELERAAPCGKRGEICGGKPSPAAGVLGRVSSGSQSGMEFWQGRAGRLHDRIVYAQGDHSWQIRRLQP